jgi:hypothetical protein
MMMGNCGGAGRCHQPSTGLRLGQEKSPFPVGLLLLRQHFGLVRKQLLLPLDLGAVEHLGRGQLSSVCDR